MKKYTQFRVRLASPEEILKWSHGEVKKHETINYRTLKPEPDGLFCERIFGPMKDYQCACGKKKSSEKGKICERCGVEITEAKVRRERMGHIKLAAPVVHTWYLKNSPSRLAILLDLKAKDLEEVVYLASYIVINPGNTKLLYKQILSEQEYSHYYEEYGHSFEALTGAEAIKKLLKSIDLKAEVVKLRKQLKSPSKQKRDKAIKRLEVVEAFNNSDNQPEWMVLDVLPVIPPDLRPMVQLDGGRFATTDLNDLYRRILNRNNRLKRQYEQNAPHLITKNEKRMLQEAVDALIDNSKRGKKAVVEKNRHLKSLSDMLRGKQGRFRQNLLGKRVDYSGRSVIVVGPDLKMYQCGIPREMALSLFKPFIIRELMKDNDQITMNKAKTMIDRHDDKVWPVLERVTREHPVLLNRAPTLHRLGIQAFEPKLIEGKAIRLHPLVTTAFNADFDGDQMAVHVPLSHEAQAEARLLMLASNNILNPKDGKPVVTPSQDMVLGNYYLTLEDTNKVTSINVYKDYNEAYLAYKNHEITLHTRILIDPRSLPNKRFTEEQKNQFLLTTLGKLIFNKILPDSFAFLNEPNNPKTGLDISQMVVKTPDYHFVPRSFKTYQELVDFINNKPANKPFAKKFLAAIIAEVFKQFQITDTSRMLDDLKDLGFKYSTISGITISASDVHVYSKKQELIEEADKVVDNLREMFELGFLTDSERHTLVTKKWNAVRSQIQEGLWSELLPDNHIYMMSDSGARGSASNFAQLAGMRGLMNNPSGDVIEVPVKASFFEGLSVSEFFTSTHGARKGSTDTALKTAESGYLTRRLVDVSQDVVVSERDCGTEKGVWVKALIGDDGKEAVSLYERIIGRYAAKDIINPQTGEVMLHRNEYIENEIAKEICDAGVLEVCIRSNLTCDSKKGVCMKCYGRNLATNKIVEVGEAVGTIAAESIGEPGTQLTMRTFHSGGVASVADITQGLPRVQELFEARNPKGKACISETDGEVLDIVKERGITKIIVGSQSKHYEYKVDANVEFLVRKGDNVTRGQKLIKGSVSPKELLRVQDAADAQMYIVEEVLKVYQSQGVGISDKHIEIIVRQMMRKIIIVTEGDSNLLPGSEVSIAEFKQAVKEMIKTGGRLPVGKPLLLGITRASLHSDSFLSAASFQETTRILTDAAIKGKKDELYGLKENVIIGGLIPAGTGLLVEKEGTFTCPHKPEEETPFESVDDEIIDEEDDLDDIDDIDDLNDDELEIL